MTEDTGIGSENPMTLVPGHECQNAATRDLSDSQGVYRNGTAFDNVDEGKCSVEVTTW